MRTVEPYFWTYKEHAAPEWTCISYKMKPPEAVPKVKQNPPEQSSQSSRVGAGKG